MPKAEDRKTPPGEPYGQATQQQDFMQQTAQYAPQVASPRTQPLVQVQPPSEEVPADQDAETVGALLAPTQRPNEPVMAGVYGPPKRSLVEVLSQVAEQSGSPDVLALLQAAQTLGL